MEIIRRAAVITNRCLQSSLRCLKSVNAKCLGGGKGKKRERRKEGDGEMAGRWEAMGRDSFIVEDRALSTVPAS